MIVVVTVFRSNNYGSLLQARALGDVLKQYDDVRFFDNRRRAFFEWGLVKSVLVAAIKHRKFKKAFFLASKLIQNYIGWKKLKSLRYVPNKNATFVLGSDEIWNVVKGNCNYGEFWGEGLVGKLVSYAPSVNNSQVEDMRNYSYVEQGLQRMAYISVRDEHSRQVVSSLVNKDVEVVLDPTLLKSMEYYVDQKFNFPKIPKYVAVYVFDSRIKVEEKKTIKEYARSKGLKLVSVGGWNDWCDCSLPAINQNPFLHYINAECVIANTFHGTAFAINFQKKFVTYAGSSKKILELLKMFRLEGRNASGFTVEKLDLIFSEQIDYRSVAEILEDNRKRSFEFISRAIA